jgi:hypothetical protein
MRQAMMITADDDFPKPFRRRVFATSCKHSPNRNPPFAAGFGNGR